MSKHPFLVLIAVMVSLGAAPPPAPPPPFKAQANVLIVDAFPGDKDLAPTLVSMDVKNVTWIDALQRLDSLTDSHHDTRTAPAMAPANVTLKLDKVPMMEALFQIMGQGAVRAEPMPVPTPSVFKGNGIQEPLGRPSSPIWSISGPFSFMLQAVEHKIQLGTKDEETLTILIQGDMEPRLHLLREAEAITLTEAIDDKGQSLLPPKPNGGAQNLLMETRLECPAGGVGKRITSLKGKVNYALQTKSETVEIDLTKFNEPLVKEIGGVEVTVAPPTGPTAGGFQSFALSFKRTTLPAERWADHAKALAAAKPLLILEKGPETKWPSGRDSKTQGDVLTRSWEFYPAPAAGAVPASKLVLTIPIETRVVTVPFAFKDLPLP